MAFTTGRGNGSSKSMGEAGIVGAIGRRQVAVLCDDTPPNHRVSPQNNPRSAFLFSIPDLPCVQICIHLSASTAIVSRSAVHADFAGVFGLVWFLNAPHDRSGNLLGLDLGVELQLPRPANATLPHLTSCHAPSRHRPTNAMPSLTTRTPSPSANHKLISELPVIDTPSPPFASKDSPWSTAILDATKLPPASRNRELVKLANNKLSNGYALFVHYVKPTLDIRRRALVDSGATKKKFHKTVGKLYEELPTSQKAFWNSEAARLRHYIQEKTITHEECVRSVGTPDQWSVIQHADLPPMA